MLLLTLDPRPTFCFPTAEKEREAERPGAVGGREGAPEAEALGEAEMSAEEDDC